MFDHVKFGVSDYAASKAFFLKALEPLGVAVVQEGPPTYGVLNRCSACCFSC
jgi:catechol 2,3-dioxygenase-like lactoylglutathione lyase family enzyme